MPFICDIELEAGQLESGPLIFDGWIESAWQKYVPGGTAFARAHDRRGPCVLELCGPGALTNKSKLKPGDAVEAGVAVAQYRVDGEDILYDRPACRVAYL